MNSSPVAIITGAGSGLGRATALAAAKCGAPAAMRLPGRITKAIIRPPAPS